METSKLLLFVAATAGLTALLAAIPTAYVILRTRAGRMSLCRVSHRMCDTNKIQPSCSDPPVPAMDRHRAIKHNGNRLRIETRREDKMSSTSNRGRLVGLLYLFVSIPGFFALIYIPSKLIVHGNAAATASNIAASETLFRIGIACNLISQILIYMGGRGSLRSAPERQPAARLGHGGIDCGLCANCAA
jgi:hypothetical protein